MKTIEESALEELSSLRNFFKQRGEEPQFVVGHAIRLLEESFQQSANAEPVSEKWLRSLGFVFGNYWKNGLEYCELEAGSNTVTVSVPNGSDWSEEEWLVGMERIPHSLMPSTRGDVLHLLQALGVSLAKGGGEHE